MKNTIVQDLQHRYDHQKDFLTLASFIDPKFKSVPLLEDDSLKEEVHSNVIAKLSMKKNRNLKKKKSSKEIMKI